MSAPAALAETLAQITRCLDAITDAPGRDEPCEHGMKALYAIQNAANALGHSITDLDDMSGKLEAVLDLLHDMASDVAGEAMKRMEQPAYDPHADWQKHEPRSAS